MEVNKAVVLSTEAQVDLVDLAHPADHIWPLDVSLPAAVLAGLPTGVNRGMEMGRIKPKPHRISWGVAAVSPDRPGDIDRGAEVCWAPSGAKRDWLLTAGILEHLEPEVL